MTAPLVTTIIPVYNNERYLAEAVASVAGQGVEAHALMLVDDGSTDGTLALAHALAAESAVPMRVVSQANAGAAAARNHGARLADSPFLAFLDSDDVWTEGRLALMLDAFAREPALDVVFGMVEQFISPELTEAERREKRVPAGPMPGHHPGGALVRREAFWRAGGFDITLEHGEIIDWVVRLREAGLRETLLPQVVFQRRVHTRNRILQGTPYAADYLRIARAAVARRKAAPPGE